MVSPIPFVTCLVISNQMSMWGLYGARHVKLSNIKIVSLDLHCSTIIIIFENVLGWVQEGEWIELWKIFNQFRPLKIVFAIWKTSMNLGARDIRCSKEINWFKVRMNQFVIQTDRSFSSTQQIHNHTDLQFHNSTLIRSNSHSCNSNITLRSESHTNPNLNESREEQNYKIQI